MKREPQSHLLIGLTSAKVRQKHSVSFSELITEYEKAKRHSVEKTVKNDFLGVFNIFCVFDANFPGNGNGSKWIAGGRATNAIGQKWQGSELS